MQKATTLTLVLLDAAGGDYRLHPGSPCVDARTNLASTITADIVGLQRPMDGNGDRQIVLKSELTRRVSVILSSWVVRLTRYSASLTAGPEWSATSGWRQAHPGS